MTDRELLELAAKAAEMNGYEYVSSNAFYGDDFKTQFAMMKKGFAPWNPLVCSKDALRLAVELRLQIKPGKHVGDGCTVETQRDGITGCTAFYDDKAQQMRQAIVHAAAEIGKAMP